jgi:hypothetical protein
LGGELELELREKMAAMRGRMRGEAGGHLVAAVALLKKIECIVRFLHFVQLIGELKRRIKRD